MSGETKSKKKYEIDMCNGAILPKLLAFTLPLMCSSVLQLLFNAADIIVVGNFAGDTAQFSYFFYYTTLYRQVV